jgi:ribosomal protein S18 acetylase RimI-like enzyme
MKPLRYASLSREQWPQIFATFQEAFADYAIPVSGPQEQTFLNRMVKNGVDFAASAGAYDGERLVGFSLTGLDVWEGEPAAFDACTGIVPGYRGFGVAPAIFELMIAGLRARGVRRFLLEVLRDNRPAVGTYRKLGFRVTREFDCLQLPLERARPAPPARVDDLVVEPVGRDLLPRLAGFADWRPSWENTLSAIARIPDSVTVLGARRGERWVGYAVYYPGLNWIQGVAVDPAERRRGIAGALLGRLLEEIAGRVPAVKMPNVEHSDAGTLAWLAGAGFEVYARQYEMELML